MIWLCLLYHASSVKISFLDDVPETKEKYLVFHWNQGRLNNNMFSLAAAMVLAKDSQRTLVLLDEHRMNSGHRQIWPGGYFDWDRLNEYVKIIQFPELKIDVSVLNDNIVQVQGALTSGTRKRPIIDIKGEGGIILNDKVGTHVDRYTSWTDDEVFSYIIPAKYIRDAADKWMLENFGDRPEVAVHARMFKEDPTHWDQRLCYQEHSIARDKYSWLRSVVAQETNAREGDEYNEWIRFYNLTCAPDEPAVDNMLKFAGVPKPSKFFLGTDGDEESVGWLNISGGARMFPGLGQASRAKELEILQPCKSGEVAGIKCDKITVFVFSTVENSLADMWIMSKANYFLGSLFSTFTGLICRWRTHTAVMKSNVCNLVPTFKERVAAHRLAGESQRMGPPVLPMFQTSSRNEGPGQRPHIKQVVVGAGPPPVKKPVIVGSGPPARRSLIKVSDHPSQFR